MGRCVRPLSAFLAACPIRRRLDSIAVWGIQEEFHATQEYVDIVKPNDGASDQVTALPGAQKCSAVVSTLCGNLSWSTMRATGISAGVRDLVGVLLEGNRIVSPARNAQNVVEVRVIFSV